MKLSVVILNYNVQYFLQQCILSVKRAVANIESEIIVIDNHSSDESCAMVRECFPYVKLIENNENLGFSKANNLAVKEARGEYICILNPDTAVTEDTFIKCLNFVESQTDLGALAVKLIDGTGCFLPESKRNVPKPKSSLLKLMGFGNRYYASHVKENENGKIDVLVGAFMLMKKAVYEEIGGFDETFFMYGEDIDFSYRILKTGYRNYYRGEIKVLHYKGESTSKDNVYFDRFYDAMRIFYKKHFSRNWLLNNMVNIAVFFSRINKKKVIESHKGDHATEPENIFVLTENLTLLKKIAAVLKREVKSASKLIFSNSNLHNSMFIFDVDYMSYTQIISVMENHRNRGNLFRIRPPGCDFILGSDQSDRSGEVVVF